MSDVPNRRRWLLVAAVLAAAPLARAQAFDHTHAAWTTLLNKHVVSLHGGQESQVRYAGVAADRIALKAYLEMLSSVSAAVFESFGKAQQMAFLINAYNAFTVELILTRYPKLKSIKDLGTLLQQPVEAKWVPLLGEKVSLDDIEHEHAAPARPLRRPARALRRQLRVDRLPGAARGGLHAERLDAQLDEQALRFMSDRTRNRYDAAAGRLEVSNIFDWFGEDFRLGHRGIDSVPAFMARHADVLADAPAERERIRASKVDIGFLDYDWALNDAR